MTRINWIYISETSCITTRLFSKTYLFYFFVLNYSSLFVLLGAIVPLGAINVVRSNGHQKLVADTKWCQEDGVYGLCLKNKLERIWFFTKIKHLRTLIEQNTFISNHLNDSMRTPYSGESISFVRCKLYYVSFFCLLYRNGHYWE